MPSLFFRAVVNENHTRVMNFELWFCFQTSISPFSTVTCVIINASHDWTSLFGYAFVSMFCLPVCVQILSPSSRSLSAKGRLNPTTFYDLSSDSTVLLSARVMCDFVFFVCLCNFELSSECFSAFFSSTRNVVRVSCHNATLELRAFLVWCGEQLKEVEVAR